MKSHTIRKYPGNFIDLMMSISRDSRCSYSGSSCFSRPCSASGRSSSRRFESFARDVLEVAVDGESRGNLELRKRVRNLVELDAAALGDFQRARQHVLFAAELLRHLGIALDE